MQGQSAPKREAEYDAGMPRGRPSTSQRTAFGKRVLAAREALGLSQAEVAAEVGLTQSAYADWERRPVALRPDQIQQLCKTLQVSAGYLFDEKPRRGGQGGPTGKLRRAFDEAAGLPRRQQNKVVEFLEVFLASQRGDQP